jgi:hypothetical protein
MFPFYTLVFPVWVVVDSCLLVSGASKMDVMLISIVIQEALADIQVLAFVHFCELLWNPCCTGFMKA